MRSTSSFDCTYAIHSNYCDAALRRSHSAAVEMGAVSARLRSELFPSATLALPVDVTTTRSRVRVLRHSVTTLAL